MIRGFLVSHFGLAQVVHSFLACGKPTVTRCFLPISRAQRPFGRAGFLPVTRGLLKQTSDQALYRKVALTRGFSDQEGSQGPPKVLLTWAFIVAPPFAACYRRTAGHQCDCGYYG